MSGQWSLTGHQMEYGFGLREVAMIRLPAAEWASPAELKELERIVRELAG